MQFVRVAFTLLGLPAIAVSLAAQSEGVEIRDGKDQPVAGAVVRVWMPPSGPTDLSSRIAPLCEAESAANGIAPCSVPRLAGTVVTVDAKEFEPLVKTLAGEALKRIVLRPGSTLQGRIVSPRPLRHADLVQSVVDATVVIEIPERKQTFSFDRAGDLGDRGELTIRGLSDSDVSVRLTVKGFLPWIGKERPGGVFEVRLEPGIPLAGRVVDEHGHPINGARIEDGGDPSGASCKTDRTGRFEIATRALPASLRIVAQGYRKGEIKVSSADKATRLLAVLHPGEGVTGKLFCSDDRSVEGLTVSTVSKVDAYTTRKNSQEVTVEHGAFRMDLPAPGVYSFRFDAPGYEPESLSDVQVTARTYVDLGSVLLRRGAGVRGTVTDAKTGDAVPGAAVELQSAGSSLLRDLRYGRVIRSVTDSRGQFTMTGASEGSYLVRLQASRFPPWFRSVSLGAGEIAELGRIALGEGAELSGRVVDRSGEPQPGLIVRFFDQAGESTAILGQATTEREGRFGGVHLAPGAYTARVFSDRVLLSQPFEIGKDREATLDLELQTVRVSGVVQRNEKPVTGGTLSLVEQLDPAERRGKIIMHGGGSASGTTLAIGIPSSMITLNVSASGEFMSERVPPGPMVATYVADDGRMWSRQVTVPDIAEYRMVIDLGGTSIEGIVVSEDGMAIPGAQLTLATARGVGVAFANSAETGNFEFADLQPGTFTIVARASGYRTRSISGITVAGGAPLPALRVVLKAGTSGTLAVRLTRTGGAPAEFVPVTLLDGAGLMVASLPTDSNGRRDFENLPPGRYTVVWADPFYGAGASEPVDVDGRTNAMYSRMLTPGARLAFECDSPECRLQPVDFISVLSSSGADLAAYLSGAAVGLRFPSHGRLMLGALSPGSYRIRLGVGGVIFDRTLQAQSGDLIVPLP